MCKVEELEKALAKVPRGWSVETNDHGNLVLLTESRMYGGYIIINPQPNPVVPLQIAFVVPGSLAMSEEPPKE